MRSYQLANDETRKTIATIFRKQPFLEIVATERLSQSASMKS
ncbi:hypothetical protein ACFQ4X_11335 [Fictibacillus halophilus]